VDSQFRGGSRKGANLHSSGGDAFWWTFAVVYAGTLALMFLVMLLYEFLLMPPIFEVETEKKTKKVSDYYHLFSSTTWPPSLPSLLGVK